MMKLKYLYAFILFLVCCGACREESETVETHSLDEETLYRPNFHFTPKANWMNDPNGMFFLEGTYHLYFQYYPEGNQWGPMHWGHASSTDLLHWKEHPIALFPDSLGYIFSGSAVVDHQNTSGLGSIEDPAVIALYTSHDPEKAEGGATEVESQSLAFSLDQGHTWTKYEGNPVIPNAGVRDFRDPKVNWDPLHDQWNMVLAAGQEIYFYRSANLLDWELQSKFGREVGAHGGVWECPDLLYMPVEGTDGHRWVLLVSINPGGPNGGSATQYFVGDFDGKAFTMDPGFAEAMATDHQYWVDFGRDNYAGVTWSGIPESDGRQLFIGWMSNWDYAQEVPTESWRSAMTLPRELYLLKDSTYHLASRPAAELVDFQRTVRQWKDQEISEPISLLSPGDSLDLSRTVLRFKFGEHTADTLYFKASNRDGEALKFGYAEKGNSFFIDRTHSGRTSFSDKFAPGVSRAPRADAGPLSGSIYLDKTSLEVFYDQGRSVMTEIFFPNRPYTHLEVLPVGGQVMIEELHLMQLQP